MELEVRHPWREKARLFTKGIPLICEAGTGKRRRRALPLRIESEGQSDIRGGILCVRGRKDSASLSFETEQVHGEDIFLELT